MFFNDHSHISPQLGHPRRPGRTSRGRGTSSPQAIHALRPSGLRVTCTGAQLTRRGGGPQRVRSWVAVGVDMLGRVGLMDVV